MTVIYRKATVIDIPEIQKFVDFWLSGRGMKVKAPGAVNDCFISKGQHEGYFKRSTILLAIDGDMIVGWAVKHYSGQLIHLLVSGPYRGKGIGGRMIQILNPPTVRAKTDQSTGDPTPFYEKRGYVITGKETSKSTFKKPKTRYKAKKNINLLSKAKP